MPFPAAPRVLWWTPAFGTGIGTALLIWSAYWLGVTSVQWHVASIPGVGPSQIGILYFIQLAPMLLLTPFLGAILDRIGGHPVLTGAGLIIGIAAAAGVLLGLLGLLSFILGAILSACLGLGMALASPAVHTLIPTTVPTEGLAPAVRTVSVIQNVARLCGPMIAGLLLLHSGVSLAVALVSVLSLTATLLLTRVPKIRAEREQQPGSGVAGLVSGFRVAFVLPPVRQALLLVVTNSALTLSHVSVLPLMTANVLEADETGFAALLAAGGVGGLLGALFPLTRIRGLRPVALLLVLSSAGLILLGLSDSLPVAILASGILAALGLMTAITLSLYIQRNITQDIRGRVMSLFTWAWGGFLPLGGLFLGFVSEHATLRTALILAAILQLLVAFVPLVRKRQTAAGQ